ncbi:hypothetical protein CPC08DRAFT_44077 [Agrocybe pediades]|nr:hypothetical protein CPC08DRAFT_44077 [Agrocybe pediades]
MVSSYISYEQPDTFFPHTILPSSAVLRFLFVRCFRCLGFTSFFYLALLCALFRTSCLCSARFFLSCPFFILASILFLCFVVMTKSTKNPWLSYRSFSFISFFFVPSLFLSCYLVGHIPFIIIIRFLAFNYCVSFSFLWNASLFNLFTPFPFFLSWAFPCMCLFAIHFSFLSSLATLCHENPNCINVSLGSSCPLVLSFPRNVFIKAPPSPSLHLLRARHRHRHHFLTHVLVQKLSSRRHSTIDTYSSAPQLHTNVYQPPRLVPNLAS